MNKENIYGWKNVEGTRGDVLHEAHKVINGKRQSKHGKPEDSFGIISEYWNTYIKSRYGINIDLGRPEVCEMMSLFKHARMAGQGYNPDNHRGATGYLALADDFRDQTEQARINTELSGFDCGSGDCSDCNRDYIVTIEGRR